MRKIFLIILISGIFSSVYAQQDLLIEAVKKQAVKIDSLEKALKLERDSSFGYQTTLMKIQVRIKNQQDSIKKLKIDSVALEKLRVNKMLTDTLLQQKNDSITLLTSFISEKEKQILSERQKNEQKIKDAKQSGKSDALAGIVHSYKHNQFDDLLNSSTRQSVDRDLQLVGDSTELKSILQDLEKYFNAKSMLEKKFDAVQIKNVQNQLNQIKRKSELLDKLKEVVSNYQIFNTGLKEMIKKIVALDKRVSVNGMGPEVEKMKRDNILSEISSYIFSYDFNFSDYPYLSNIMLEIIKRKQSNLDTELKDLLEKL